MHISSERLAQGRVRLADKTAFVGFDGFVDRMVQVVDERQGPAEAFKPIRYIHDYAKRMDAAAGKSTNVELYMREERFGGNGPLFARALLTAEVPVKYVGTLGDPDIHPVFLDFVAHTQAVSIANPGITYALEFEDGKIMQGLMAHFADITYDCILKHVGEGILWDALNRADCIGIMNWTMMPHLGDILEQILMHGLSKLAPHPGRFFILDPADPEKRPRTDLLAYLKILERYEAFGKVILTVNLKEASEIAAALGVQEAVCGASPDSLAQSAYSIRQKLNFHCLVIHHLHCTAAATAEGKSVGIEVPFCEEPKTSTGAGDHFNAGFALGELMELGLREKLMMATAMSGHYVRNATVPTWGAIENFFLQWEKGF